MGTPVSQLDHLQLVKFCLTEALIRLINRKSRIHNSGYICVLLSFMHLLHVFTRWRRWGGEWGRKTAILLWLHHALPDSFLESPLRFCPTNWILERLGLLLCLHFPYWRSDSCDRRLGLTFRLHRRSQRLGHCGGLCCPWHLCSRWVSCALNPLRLYTCFLLPLGFACAEKAAAWWGLCNLRHPVLSEELSLKLLSCTLTSCKQRRSLFHLLLSACIPFSLCLKHCRREAQREYLN